VTSIQFARRGTKNDRSGNPIVFAGLVAIALMAPLAFGAVQPWAIFAIELSAALLLFTWVGQQVFAGPLTIHYNSIFAPVIAFGAVTILQLFIGSTAYRNATESRLFLYAAFGMLAFLLAQTVEEQQRLRLLAATLIMYGASMSVFALLQGFTSGGKLYWIRVPSDGGWIYGPYVNHNHYAGLMELLAPVAIAVSLSRCARSHERFLAGLAAVLMVGTIFFSGSRGGALACTVQIVLLIAILIWNRTSSNNSFYLTAIFLAATVALVIWIGGRDLAGSELSGGTRLTIDRDSWHAFLSKPILGYGLGNFPEVYPQFKTLHSNLFVNHAHNDYLELLVETGIAGLACGLWFLLTAYRGLLRKLRGWPETANGVVGLACALGITGLMVHSALDFNLQIPANALLFYLMCTIAAAPTLPRQLAGT
jgi:O-antigen ligase